MKLVIVESPAKRHTIGRYLGEGYEVVASLGHIRDLATSGKEGLGIDVEHSFAPRYVINKDKKKAVDEIVRAAKKADEVILATDPDREGEAIAWHLADVLKLSVETTKRLEFHEITRQSIGEAMEKPRTIDMNLVASQEARRIVDRIIGFKLSTLLQRKIKSRSAGRVQSVTLKLIVDHEKEIQAFVPEEYWTITAKVNHDDRTLDLSFDSLDGEKMKVTDQKTADAILARLKDVLTISEIKQTIRLRESKEPLTTSTLQQEAFNRFKYKTKKTSSIAQKLYEGISLGDEPVGLITYMRTDSTRLSETFISRATNYITEVYGEAYVAKTRKGRKSKAKEQIQDAHEAIRPTSTHRTPESIKQYLSHDEYNIYKLIYSRAIASLMPAKEEAVTTVYFENNGVRFKIEGVITKFEGYAKLCPECDAASEKPLPILSEGESFTLVDKNAVQNFTKPPARYSEARVVKLMEELGIGRPSTYASTIETIQKRKYVSSDKGILAPTDQGTLTTETLEQHFPDLINVDYTAKMEVDLDNVVDGNTSRENLLGDFYTSFSEKVIEAYKTMETKQAEETGELCPECGKPIVIRDGKFGKFEACSNYPTCKYKKPKERAPLEFSGEMCPECGKPLVYRLSKKGEKFTACSGFPKCRYIKEKFAPIVYGPEDYIRKCPDCETGQIVKKKGRFGPYLGCTNAPTCRHMEKIYTKKSKD